MIKILISGLPRSGTTILTNYVNSSKNSFCFIEPHWEYKLYGEKNFYTDKKLRGIKQLYYHEDAPLPLDEALDKISSSYEIVGFKETFRSELYGEYLATLPNRTLIESYIAAGYTLIPIIRHPLYVWNSYKKSNPPADSWISDIQYFLDSYCEFTEMIDHRRTVIYERFVADPAKELSDKTTLPIIGVNNIEIRDSRMGDATANHSSSIELQKINHYYTVSESKLIEASLAIKTYESIISLSESSFGNLAK